MAREITCDLCHEEPAEIMYSTFGDGSTVAVGPLCAPQFVYGLAIALGILPDPADVPVEETPAPRMTRKRKRDDVIESYVAPAEQVVEGPVEVS
jgi:hypothetical protein